MSIIFTIIVYLIAFFLGGAISCFTRFKAFRAILLPIFSLICIAFIQFNGKELKNFKLAQFAAFVVLFLFLFSRIKLYIKKKQNLYSLSIYKSKVDTCYMASFSIIIFLMIIYTGWFSWLFGTTSKVIIIFMAMGIIGITLDDDKHTKQSNYNKNNDKYTNNKQYNYNNYSNNHNTNNNENKKSNNNYSNNKQNNNQNNNHQNEPDSYDPYKVLGVSPNDDFEYIKKHYRKLVKKYHPDVCKDQKLEDKMKEINTAYEEIKKRKS